MKDKIFIDTNIWIYATLQDTQNQAKREVAFKTIQSNNEIFVNTQILNEFYNVLLRHKVSDNKILTYINEIIKNTIVSAQDMETLNQAWTIKPKYLLSLWDSLIVSAALQNNCSILYSEDMQHNQLIENSLKIINPFK